MPAMQAVSYEDGTMYVCMLEALEASSLKRKGREWGEGNDGGLSVAGLQNIDQKNCQKLKK